MVEEGDRVSDRRAVRRHLADRGPDDAPHDVRRAACVGRRGRMLRRGGPGAPVCCAMNTAAAVPASSSEPSFEVYRDDGPIARALGSALGDAVRLPPVTLLVAGAVPLLAMLAIAGDDASRPIVAAVLAWLVLCAGVSSGRPHT